MSDQRPWRVVLVSLIEARSREDAEATATILAETGVPQRWPCRVYVEPLAERDVDRLTVVVYRTWTREELHPTDEGGENGRP